MDKVFHLRFPKARAYVPKTGQFQGKLGEQSLENGILRGMEVILEWWSVVVDRSRTLEILDLLIRLSVDQDIKQGVRLLARKRLALFHHGHLDQLMD